MNKNSVLNQLMCLRINSVMNSITEQDEDYQALLHKADHHTAQLESMQLSREAIQLVDDCISGHNAIGSRYGMLAYLLGFSDCRELLLSPTQPEKETLTHEHS